MKNVWFTSDSHFSHRNIIKYCNRPFASVEEMDESLIERWNSVVRPGDDVWHLGDYAMCNPDKMQRIFDRLQGNKHLIKGNHDRRKIVTKIFHDVRDYMELKTEAGLVVLCHYPFASWNKAHHGSVMLHGHCHGNFPGSSQLLDVGVDCWDYTPVNMDQIRERLLTLPAFRSPDHH